MSAPEPTPSYFIQTQPSPLEGPHAQEVSPEDFAAAKAESPMAPVEVEADSHYLRLDLLEPSS